MNVHETTVTLPEAAEIESQTLASELVSKPTEPPSSIMANIHMIRAQISTSVGV